MELTQPKKKKSIFKKILIGIGIFIGFTILLAILFPLDYYKEGVDAYNKRNYEKALYNLNNVKPDDKNYKDAIAKIQEIKPIVDSLEKIEKLQKINEEKKMNPDPSTIASSTDTTNTNSTTSVSNGVDLKTKIANNIKSLDGGDDLTKSPMNSAQDFIITSALFKAYAITINEGKTSADKEVLKLTDELQNKVLKSQQKNFPKIRKAYYEFIKSTLWENDISVDISGSSNTVLKLSGGYFAANKNIKTTQEALSEMLSLLRFKQIQYTWYKGQDEFTYYTIESAKDSELEE